MLVENLASFDVLRLQRPVIWPHSLQQMVGFCRLVSHLGSELCHLPTGPKVKGGFSRHLNHTVALTKLPSTDEYYPFQSCEVY